MRVGLVVFHDGLKVKKLVSLCYRSSCCLRLDERMIRFAIIIHLIIAYIFICLNESFPMSNFLICSRVRSFVSVCTLFISQLFPGEVDCYRFYSCYRESDHNKSSMCQGGY